MSDVSDNDKTQVGDKAVVESTQHGFKSFEKDKVDEALEIFNDVERARS